MMATIPRFFKDPLKSRNPLLWAVLIASAWLALWYLPWQAELHSIVWLQLGGALILFIAPGACVYGLLADEGQAGVTFNHVTFGFVFSHLILAVLGTVGRYFQLTFEVVKFTMAVLGFIFIVLYLRQKFRDGIRLGLQDINLSQSLPVLMLLLVSVAAFLVVIQRVLSDDDMTYLAYLTHFQLSDRLDFNDLIFGEPRLVHPRYWLMSVPFAQALLADLSQTSGILIIAVYYEPFLMGVSVLCWYELARALQFSPPAAGASSILQLAFLLLLAEYLHPGFPFFSQLSTDKATASFILAPVFFQSLIRLLDRPTKNNGFLFLLTGLSLTLMHPVILAFSVFIGGALILFRLKRETLRQLILPIGILLLILAPQVALRFASPQSQADIPYTSEAFLRRRGMENLVKSWVDTPFYGFNPEVLGMNIPYSEKLPFPEPIKKWGWLVLSVLSAVFALRRARHDLASQFILICFLLSLLAWFPLTGWIIGYFLSAWMLSRAPWLFPFGLSTVYVLSAVRDFIKLRRPVPPVAHPVRPSTWPVLTITLLTLGLFFLYMRENNLPNHEKFLGKAQRYKDLALAGQALDQRISDQAYVMGSEELNDLIPGISHKARLITFRISDPDSMLYYTFAEREQRIADTATLFSKSTPASDKLSLLEKYDVHFLLLQRNDLALFKDLVANYPNQITVMEVGGVILIQID